VSVAAGKLRRRVEIQRATETTDALGQPVQTWATVATRWMGLEERGGRELYFARQVNALVTGIAEGRPYAGLTAKDRLKVGSRILNIAAVRLPEGGQMLVEYTEKV
jgi:SPP1 family predicted phage head-tail adaptor